MAKLKLLRYCDTGILTQGILLLDGKWIADTLEKPWKDNKQFISCIPAGEYKIQYAEKYKTVKGKELGEVFKVLEVAHRDGILIHAGNYVQDLEGCLAIGIKSGVKVLSSRETLSSVVHRFKEKEGFLEILNLWDLEYGK